MTQHNVMTMTPAARGADPESSHLAAEELIVSGRRASQQQQVLDAVRQWPNCTSAELAQLMGVSRYVVARRLPELAAAKHVRRGASRECAVGKRQAVTWHLPGDLLKQVEWLCDGSR